MSHHYPILKGLKLEIFGSGVLTQIRPVNRLCGIMFNRFYRLEIHSLMVCIFDPAYELLPPWTKELYGTCVLLPLYCTFSLTSSPLPPSQSKVQYIQTVYDWGGWGGGC
jgi:hypothetical protein